EGAGRVLEERGADVILAPERLLEHAGDVWFAALQQVGGPSFAEMLGGGRPVRLPLELLLTLAGRGRYSWPALFFCIGERIGVRDEEGLRQAEREMRRLARRFAEMVGPNGVLVMPTHPRAAPVHNAAVLRPFDFLYTAVFNSLRVPVTTAPFGFDASGLPLGVQIASARGNDHVTVAAAQALEERVGPWRPASGGA